MSKNIPKTELLYEKSKPIDHLSLFDGLSLMIKEQKNAALEVKRSIKSIEYAIEAIYKHLTLNSKGRLIYVGAGTSGRIGVQDGVELFPTFNWPKERLDFIIAGGINALLNALVFSNKLVISLNWIPLIGKSGTVLICSLILLISFLTLKLFPILHIE